VLAPSAEPETLPSVVQLLDETTANRIAAGEVVERPSSVVKELVENALDAGARRIEVLLEDGGRRGIAVRDDGCGMGRADAILALQRHATSKIRSADDLFAIHTLGFRGEALPSIASVSDLTLTTKRADDEVGTRLVVRAGDLVRVEDAAVPDGTSIVVENLFVSVPARLKFLKTAQTELNHAAEFLQRLILAYPQVALRLAHDGHEMIAWPGSDEPRHALAEVFGRDVAREMVALRSESAGLVVHGFVSKPSVSKASRAAQAFFVNGRHVRSRTLMHAFDQALRHLMESNRYPVACLFVEIAPELVDVNVHPAKVEVRFTRDGDVYAAVHKAIEAALLTGGLVPEVRVQASLPAIEPERRLPPKPSLSNFVAPEMPERDPGGLFVPDHAAPERAAVEPSTAAPQPYIGFDGHRIGRLRVLGQSRNTYIVAETDDALLLIDQHVAHERVLYEQMMNGVTERAERYGIVAQHLALPQTLELAPTAARLLSERLDALMRAGFVLEPFGQQTFLVRAVPATIAQKPYLEILKEIVEDLTQASAARRLLVPHEAAVIYASCRLAVKKGDPLTLDEMTRVLTDLAQMRNPFTCPHGRPILLALPHTEMDRKFHRTGVH
jgi:DNA mismatch repair protein MutL